MFDFLFVNHFDALRNTAAIGFVAWLTWLVARHGVTWVWTKATSAWSSAAGDFSGLVARVEALEADVGIIKTVVPVPVAPANPVAPVSAPKVIHTVPFALVPPVAAPATAPPAVKPA